jgi:hypothetical protein
MDTSKEILELLAQAKLISQRYRALTGKPLGITGEIAEYEAARILGLQLVPARQAGFDAIENRDGKLVKIQIKGRCFTEGNIGGQRLGSIDITKEFDTVVLILLNDKFEAYQIYEAERDAIIRALSVPGSKSRNERGALSVSKFKAIGKLKWPSKGNG